MADDLVEPRHQCRLRALRGSAPAGRPRHHRRPRLWRRRRRRWRSLARAAAEGLIEGGVLPVLKHIPGHGRARADSHESLPVVETPREVLEATDFAPFRLLADLPLGMTAHVVYAAIDPDHPATTSKRVIEEIIRGHIGFDGALMSDDLSMGALAGSLAEPDRGGLRRRLRSRAPLQRQAGRDGRGGLALAAARRRGGAPLRRRRSARLHPAGQIARSSQARAQFFRYDRGVLNSQTRSGTDGSKPVRLRSRCRAPGGRARALVVDVDGFEGPLDLLLALARTQKVDLSPHLHPRSSPSSISPSSRRRAQVRLELAADYLVMAAWLAFLKSRLLLPEPPKEEGPSAADLAADLAERLRRLERIRTAAAHLATRDRMGQDVFARGRAEPLQQRRSRRSTRRALYDLLAAYGAHRQKDGALAGAFRAAPRALAGGCPRAAGAADRPAARRTATGRGSTASCSTGWPIRRCAPPRSPPASPRRLEMVREGMIELQQDGAFAPIWIRAAARPQAARAGA